MASFREMLRPVVTDAAESINYATGYPVARILEWFDRVDDGGLQTSIMGAVQDAIVSALAIDVDRDYSEGEE